MCQGKSGDFNAVSNGSKPRVGQDTVVMDFSLGISWGKRGKLWAEKLEIRRESIDSEIENR